MKYLSLFSGIGGFELGIIKAHGESRDNQEPKADTASVPFDGNSPVSEHSTGRSESPECVGYSEIDKYAVSIYQKHFPEHKNYGDITKINAEELPDFDLLVGGFPCQAFSIAGKRKGFDDTRGTLFFDLARILRAKRPWLFLFENVKGLLSHDNGQTFATIISAIDELGYDCQWQVLNSKNHGVPQNRERVFIVGHLRGTGRPEVFPIRESNQNHTYQLNQPTHSNDKIYGVQGISQTINTAQGGRRQPKIAPTLRANHHNTADVHFITQKSAEADNASNCKNIYSLPQIRRLTPLEAERLQGFPDGWTDGVSDTQRYKCLGNAVTVNVIKEIVSRMI